MRDKARCRVSAGIETGPTLISVHAIDKAGYGAVARTKDPEWRRHFGAEGRSGLDLHCLPGDRNGPEARYIEAAVNGIIVTSIYLPNGNPQPGPKLTTSSTGS